MATKQKKTKRSVTHVFMVIDKSGSMEPLRADVIGGFNSYVHDLSKDTEHEYSITAVLFDVTVHPYCNAASPIGVPAMDTGSYRPADGTALLDAVGFTIGNVAYVNPNDKVLVVISTDGHENSSREETTTSIRAKITDRMTQGWDFIYLGQGVDQWDQAQAMGVHTYLHTNSTSAATAGTYSGLATGTKGFAGGQSITETAKDIEDEVRGK
jgi:hypothetical protein